MSVIASERSSIVRSIGDLRLDGEDGFQEDDSRPDIFAQSWDEALKRCKEGMNNSDYKSVLLFGSPEKLTRDLRLKEEKAGKSWFSRVLPEVEPVLEMLKSVSNFFMISMKPGSIETTMIWGFLHLVIELSLKSEKRWKQMIGMLRKTRRTLERCKVSAEMFDHNEELKQALLEVFIALILFWAEASKYMRENNPDSSTSKFLESKFESTWEDMEEAVKNLQLCATIRATAQGEPSRRMSEAVGVETVPQVLYTDAQLHQLPYENLHHFVGRNSVLQRIDEILKPTEPRKASYFSIWGLGGMGKSQTALAYAYRNAGNFDSIFWVRAETEVSLQQSFTDFAMVLQLPGASRSNSHEANREQFQDWLLQRNKPWLIIFDNVEDITKLKDFWPTGNGSVLLTTRYYAVAEASRGPEVTKLHIECLNAEESKELFGSSLTASRKEWADLNNVPEDENKAADELLDKLRGLPLGIRQMAALIKVKKITVAKFLQRYNKEAGNTKRLFGNSKKAFTFDQDYGFDLETVWRLSFESLVSEEDSESATLLGLISLLSPDVIPAELFLDDHEDLKSIEFCGDEDLFDCAKEELVDAALIDFDDDTLSVHRLVQTAYLHYMSREQLQNIFDAATLLVSQKFPKTGSQSLHAFWPLCQQYYQHASSLAERYRDFGPLVARPELSDLLTDCAWYLYETGEYHACIDLITIAKDACPDKGGFIYSCLLNAAGACYFELNEQSLCRENYEGSMTVLLGLPEAPHHLTRAYVTHNLGNIQSAEGNYDKALELFHTSREMKESRNETSIDLDLTYAGIGRALIGKNDLEAARPFLDKALSLTMRDYGADSFHGVLIRCDIGNLCYKQGNIKAATKSYEEGLEIALAKSPRHLQTASLLYKLAGVKHEVGDERSARTYLGQAMNIAEREHADGDIARIKYRKHKFFLDSGDAKEAEEAAILLSEAKEIRERLEKAGMGPSDPGIVDDSYDHLVCHFFR